MVPDTAAAARRPASLAADWAEGRPTPAAAAGGLEVQFRPDPTSYDGRFANNGWLQELPKPVTKLTWDNAALVSPATADELGVRQDFGWHRRGARRRRGDVVELRYQRPDASASPVWVARPATPTAR